VFLCCEKDKFTAKAISKNRNSCFIKHNLGYFKRSDYYQYKLVGRFLIQKN